VSILPLSSLGCQWEIPSKRNVANFPHQCIVGNYPQKGAAMTKLAIRKQQDFSMLIRAMRQRQGLSQAELAEQLGFSRDYLVELESGRSNLFITRLLRVLHEFDVSLSAEYSS
jgi:DNA-binding transcriptional regulator YiaG